MFKNKNEDGTLNLCGAQVARYRKNRKLSQRGLADHLQLLGIEQFHRCVYRSG